MLTTIDEGAGGRVLTVRIHEATIDAELVSALESALDDVEQDGSRTSCFSSAAAGTRSPEISRRGRPAQSGATCGTSLAGMRLCGGFPG
jgi:hypothetical protein